MSETNADDGRGAAVDDLYAVARHIAALGMQAIDGGDARTETLALYAASRGIAAALRGGLENMEEPETLADLDRMAEEIAARWQRECSALALARGEGER